MCDDLWHLVKNRTVSAVGTAHSHGAGISNFGSVADQTHVGLI